MERPQLTIVRRKSGVCNEPRNIYAGDPIPKNYCLFHWTDRDTQNKWRKRINK